MQQQEPIVSVIVPTYNRANLLPRCIRSILAQTYKNFELLIVDDGSTDNTSDVVASFSDPRIRYLPQEKNRGAAYARNIGIQAARGVFISTQGSDDEWFPENLTKKIECFRNLPETVGVVYSRFYKIHKGGERVLWPPAYIKKREGNLFSEFLHGNFITDQAALVRKCVYDKVGLYDASLPGMQEWDMWFRISKIYEFKFISEPLLVTYYTEGSITAHSEWRLQGREIIFRKHIEDFRKYPKIFALHAFTIGNARALRGNMNEAHRYLQLAFWARPMNIKYCVAYILSLFSSKKLYKTFASHAKHLV